MVYTVGTLFSGIGVPDLAAELLGMTTVWQVEKEPFAQKVLRKNFPDAALYGDIFEVSNLPYVDVVVAGFPCQPFSVAGKRMGEKDERYLVPEMFRVIEEVQPRVALFENVPGFASIADGNTFRDFLRALAEMGFDAEWGHISASDFGAPHRRERWWCVAYANGRRRAQRHAAVRRISQLDEGRAVPDNSGSTRRNGRQTQPRLGRNAAWLAHWLDGFEWPAGPGEQQKSWEPPRVVSGRVPDRAARLKALGNTMAFPVVYAIMSNIKAALENDDAATEAAGD